MTGGAICDGGTEELGPDEMYCTTCGEMILKKAEICPECGVRNEVVGAQTEPPRQTGSGWYMVFVGTLIGWVLVTLVIGTTGNPFRGDLYSPVGILLGLVLLVSWFGMPIAGYYDIQYVKNNTDWEPSTILWLIGFFSWFLMFIHIVAGFFYLVKRHNAFSNEFSNKIAEISNLVPWVIIVILSLGFSYGGLALSWGLSIELGGDVALIGFVGLPIAIYFDSQSWSGKNGEPFWKYSPYAKLYVLLPILIWIFGFIIVIFVVIYASYPAFIMGVPLFLAPLPGVAYLYHRWSKAENS